MTTKNRFLKKDLQLQCAMNFPSPPTSILSGYTRQNFNQHPSEMRGLCLMKWLSEKRVKRRKKRWYAPIFTRHKKDGKKADASTAQGSCQVLLLSTSSGYFRRLLLLFVLTMPTSQLVAGEHGHGVFGGHESEVIRIFYMKYCKFLRVLLGYLIKDSTWVLNKSNQFTFCILRAWWGLALNHTATSKAN